MYDHIMIIFLIQNYFLFFLILLCYNIKKYENFFQYLIIYLDLNLIRIKFAIIKFNHKLKK